MKVKYNPIKTALAIIFMVGVLGALMMHSAAHTASLGIKPLVVTCYIIDKFMMFIPLTIWLICTMISIVPGFSDIWRAETLKPKTLENLNSMFGEYSNLRSCASRLIPMPVFQCVMPEKYSNEGEKENAVREQFKANTLVRHFKGNLYYIIAIAEHTETGEQLVIYRAEYGERKIYARPHAMFASKVDKLKYPEVTQEYRFETVEVAEGFLSDMSAPERIKGEPQYFETPTK